MGNQRSYSSSTGPARRAWRLLRLALMWARKGGILKCKLMAQLKSSLHNHNNKRSIRYYGGERELTFDETPITHLKMARPNSLGFMIPCIKIPDVDFDYDFGDEGDHDGGCEAGDYYYGVDLVKGEREVEEEEEEEGIDVKAEEFIAKFYQQIKLQREVSVQRRNNAN